MSSHITLKNLSCIYDKRKTDGINDINLTVKKGSIFSLIGPSGSGKTTLLKCIKGLVKNYQGEIQFHEETKISYLDQHIELPLQMTVIDFLANEINDGKNSQDQIINQVRTTLSQLDMTNEIESIIEQLSGGQKQRLIIAKSLITNPTMLLLDEPFSNLDNILRKQLLAELFDFFKEQELTIIWVTHNTDEALSFSDTIALLNFGKIQHIGKPQEVYAKPANFFTSQFFTESNLIPTKLESYTDSTITFKLFKESRTIPMPLGFTVNKEISNQDILVIIHPENIILSPNGEIQADITQRQFKGALTRLEMKIDDYILNADIASSSNDILNKNVKLKILFDNIHCLSQL